MMFVAHPTKLRVKLDLSINSLIDDYKNLFMGLFLKKRTVGTAILVNVIAIFFVAGSLSILIPALIKDVFLYSSIELGWFWGVMSLGTVLGSYLSTKLDRVNRISRMYIGWLVFGLFLIFIPLYESKSLFLIFAFILGISGAVADVLFATIIQSEIPAENISKTFASFSTLANSMEALSALVFATLSMFIGVKFAIIIGGFFTILISIFTILKKQRLVSQPKK